MELDLGCVADFLVVLEEGGYRRAAARLALSPPALSRRISRLEQQVGRPLLLRGPVGMLGPTAAGLAFASAAGPLLQAARMARELALEEVPVVRLGIPGERQSLPDWMRWSDVRRRYQAQVPDVRLELLGLPFTALYDALKAGVVDVLWGAADPTPASMAVAPGGTVNRMAVIQPHHPLTGASQVTVADVVDLPLQANPAIPASWMATWLLGDVRPVRQARCVESAAVNVHQVLEQTGRGDTIGIVAEWVAPLLPSLLHAVPVDDLPPHPIWVGRRREDRRGPVLALVNTLSAMAPERLAGNAWMTP